MASVMRMRVRPLRRHLGGLVFVAAAFSCLFFLSSGFLAIPDADEALYYKTNDKPTPGIPKHIHQMWKSHDVPKEWQECAKHCRELNPDYNYTLWSDEEIDTFLETHYAWFMPTYRSYPHHISRPDAARYFILYHYGGVYVDIDIDCKVPFDEILNVTGNMDAVIAATYPIGITNNFMAASSGDTLIKHVIQGLIGAKGWYLTPHMTVMMSTGPWYVALRYRSYPFQERVKKLSVEEYQSVFNHQHASSWHSWDGRLFVWLDHHQTPLLRLLRGLIYTVCFVLLMLLCRSWWRRFKTCRSSHQNV